MIMGSHYGSCTMSSSHAPIRLWYEDVTISDEAPYALLLDGRTAHTSSGITLAHKSYMFMQQIQKEWQRQDTFLVLHTLPLTRLLSGFLEMDADVRLGFFEELYNYSQHELLCYQADAYTPLAQQQQRSWQPWLEWGKEIYGHPWQTTHSIMPIVQSQALIDAIKAYLATLCDVQIFCYTILTQSLGSYLITDALLRSICPPEEALACAWLEHDTHMAQWGDDPELQEKRTQLAHQIRDVLIFHGASL
ncbi:MAG: hypothetical protein EAY65_01830 [Alphaproteobacteria bacterium]|nr:MAG: hypothetical protein EAY65_01830 [Alphaproteobacteria bacterium]